MNRIAGIVIAAFGLLLIVLSVSQITAGLTGTGIALLLLGILMIGLSFVKKPESDDTPRMSTPATLTAIFYSPSEVFQNLRRHPRWLVAVLIMSLLSAVYFNAFLYKLTPDRVTNYAIDKTLEIPFLANNEAARKNVEAGRAKALEDNRNPVLRAGQAVNGFVEQIFLYAFFGAIFFLFALAMGGRMNYWQAFAAAVYAAFPVAVVRFILNSIVLGIKDSDDIHPIIGQRSLIQDSLNFLVVPSEHPVLYVLLGSFSLLGIYWAVMNAIGAKNTGENISASTAWAATLTIFGVILLFGMLITYLFPSFIS